MKETEMVRIGRMWKEVIKIVGIGRRKNKTEMVWIGRMRKE